jgi:imidazoleglycerol phosphate synthase glutamine amidotransferase subunit HisH
MVGSGSNMAVQFHPEKSGEVGLNFLSQLIHRAC